MTTELSIFDRPIEVPEDLLRMADEKGWPEDLIRRACQLRVGRGGIEWWLTHDQPTPDRVRQNLDRREQLMFGTMRVREAIWSDDEALADLYASSPEEIGDWQVTVERGPYPFAQFRLQEHVSVSVLEDRGVILAATADSSRNTVVGGERTTVHIASAWRVRQECRGMGHSQLLRMAGGPACAWFGMWNYYYVRSGNVGALGWIKSILGDAVKDLADFGGDVPGVPVTVYHLAARPYQGDASGIRLASPADLRRCVRLINRTHRVCDLFRPYSDEFLEQRLNDPSWGDKPEFWIPVYGWPDYYVLEEDGQVVACAGLWDKGRHVREVWRPKAGGESRVVDCTALMDFGYASGREDALARLIGHLVGRTHELGRSHLTAPIEQLPSLVASLQSYDPTPETRALHWQRYEDDNWKMDARLKRPYTDMAYW